jgi:nucleoside-diphosphate-sugar epimerase
MYDASGTKLICGCGYLGFRVAQLWRKAGQHVMAVTRSEKRSLELATAGLFTIGADVTQPQTLACLGDLPKLGGRGVDCVLFSVGHDRAAGPPIGDVYAGGVKNVLAALPETVQRLIYISTTGVYGPATGNWVDEGTPPDPQREGGRASLAAEQILARHALGANSVILRLAGLYGPGRVPFLSELRSGEPIPAPSAGFLNLIHVDDAAAVVVAAGRLPAFDGGPRVFCVSDGCPVERGEFYREAARQIGAPPPRFVEPDPKSPRAARAAANRRVRNARMLHALDVKLAYSDYRAGLAAILETQNQ